MEFTEHELKLLRHRFCEDSGAPINVLSEPYFTDRLYLFEKDYNTLTSYNEYCKYVADEFGNVTKFLESYHSLRKRIINTVSNSDAFKRFQENEKITKEIKDFTPVIGNTNLYTQEQIKEGSNCFLSIDMKKANFQTLKLVDPAIVLGCETYEDFMKKFTDMPLAIKSKKTREIIFGQMNPNRTMKYERIIMGKVEKTVTYMIDKWFDLFSMNSDELIYKLKPDVDFEPTVKTVSDFLTENGLHLLFGLSFRIEFFKLKCYSFKTQASDKLMNVFVKEHTDGKKTYKCANEIYFPQTYKLINGLKITDSDLVFYFDKTELAKFFSPLIMVENH